MDFLTKFIFHLKKPKLIIVADKPNSLTIEALFQILKPDIKCEVIKKINLGNIFKNQVLILNSDFKENLVFFIKHSKKPVLAITQLPDDRLEQITKLAENLPSTGCLILNFDNETVREIRNKTPVFTLAFGFQKMADLRASDLSIDQKEGACNFKIDYDGNIIPIWLKNVCSEQEVLSILAAISCGIQLGLNLVEISQALKDFK